MRIIMNHQHHNHIHNHNHEHQQGQDATTASTITTTKIKSTTPTPISIPTHEKEKMDTTPAPPATMTTDINHLLNNSNDNAIEIEQVTNEEDVINQSRLVVNLYPRSYTFCFGDSTKESNAIDYSDRYLLDCLDNEEIPSKLLNKVVSNGNPFNIRPLRNCLLAEIRDYRNINGSQRNSPITNETVLRPTSNLLMEDFEDIMRRSYKKRRKLKKDHSELFEGSNANEPDVLSYEERLNLEKRFINETASPLCLDPSPLVGLIQNRIQYERLKWNDKRIKNCMRKYKKSLDNERKDREIAQNIAEEKLKKASSSSTPAFPILDLVQRLKETKKIKRREDNTTSLYPVKFQDYPNIAPPSDLEDILKIISPAETAALRPISNECIINKKEEFILETERRKKPHTTKLSIFQRGDDDSFFGELQMEAISDNLPPTVNPVMPGSFPPTTSVNNNTPAVVGGKPQQQQPSQLQNAIEGFSTNSNSNPESTLTKCQFELGCLRSVQLYVRQFSEIFTEDGRRPCRVTYEKIGEHPPKLIYTSPKGAPIPNPNSQNNTTTTTPLASIPNPTAHPGPISSTTSSGNTATTQTITSTTTTIAQKTLSLPPSQSPSTSTSSTATTVAISQPPVQIVHPQPRVWNHNNNNASNSSASSGPTKVYNASSISSTSQQPNKTPQQQQQQQGVTVASNSNASASATVNFNLNVKSTGIVGIQQQQPHQQQQILTRPTVNINQAQRLQAPLPLQIQQQSNPRQQIRIKHNQASSTVTSQQQQQQQQPPNTLATLLLSGTQPNSQNNLNSRPFTMSIQPQQQQQQQLQQQQNKPITMVIPPQPQNSSTILNLNNVNIGPLQMSHQNFQQHNPNQIIMITSNQQTGTTNINQSLLNQVQHQGNLGNQQVSVNIGALGNILSVSSANMVHNSYPTTFSNILQHRQMPNTVSIMSPPGILISNNSLGNANDLLQQQQQRQEIEEISVPDLNTLLSNSSHQLQQQHHIQQQPNQKQTNLDGLNLNLKLDLNLNLTNSNSGKQDQQKTLIYEQQPASGDNSSNMLSPTKQFNHQQGNSSNVITLNDLLASPLMVVSSSSQGQGSSNTGILSSPTRNNQQQQQILMSPPSVSPSSSTPRLSALLANTPSADSQQTGTLLGPSSNISIVDSTTSSSNLLDRLAASLNSSQTPQQTNNSRASNVAGVQHRSGLASLASVTPNVVLENPVLAATLTTPNNRSPYYRQIAPAPATNPSQHQQPQQLINLLGLVSSPPSTGNPPGRGVQQQQAQNPQTIRINGGKSTNNPGANR